VKTNSHKKEEFPMSTSLLYHGFGVHGYDYVNSKFNGGAVMFTLRPKLLNSSAHHVNPVGLSAAAQSKGNSDLYP
jgi:hypothetical protein